MPLSLRESQALNEAAKVLYTFLPGSGSSSWKGHVTFASVATQAGVGEFWVGGSKEPAICRLLECTLERRRGNFEPLILGIVKEGLKYRQRSGKPITKDEIMALNRLISDVGFKFPSLWDPEFLRALHSEEPLTATNVSEAEVNAAKQRALERSFRNKKLEDLKAEFLALAAAVDRQKAGIDFEKILTRTFCHFDLEPRLSYRVVGEQIDGSLKLDNEIYLIEAKWEASKMGQAPLLVFRSKIEGKSTFTRGIFIAANGFTDEALEALRLGKQSNFFLVDGYDLSFVLHGHIALDAMLREKQRRFAEEGKLLHRLNTCV